MGYTIPKLVTIVIVGVILTTAGISSYNIVDAGNRGFLLTFGAVDTSVSLEEGLHMVIPYIQDVKQTSIQKQKYVASQTDGASQDLQRVITEVTVNYHPDPNFVPILFKEVGIYYEDRIIDPVVEETVKAVTANYNAEELITKRPQVKSEIENGITERLKIDNLIVDAVSITDFQFSSAFSDAIEAKVEMEQQALKAEREVDKMRAEADQAIETARGVAESIKLKGDADAYALNVVGKALADNPDLLIMENIKQWNGILPYYLSSGEGGSNPVLLLQQQPVK